MINFDGDAISKFLFLHSGPGIKNRGTVPDIEVTLKTIVIYANRVVSSYKTVNPVQKRVYTC